MYGEGAYRRKNRRGIEKRLFVTQRRESDHVASDLLRRANLSCQKTPSVTALSRHKTPSGTAVAFRVWRYGWHDEP